MHQLLPEGALRLGFGAMRLPMQGEMIDLARMTEMVDAFLAAGGRYFDTAYPYHGGTSETALRETLVKRYPRDRFLLADKMPLFELKEASDLERSFQTQLERTGSGHFDFYLLHSLNDKRLPIVEETDAFGFICRKRDEGLIRHIGFSFHDTAEVLDKILTAHPEVEFVQLQLNYFDWESDTVQSRLCYETAVRHNKPVIVMEPVRGGSLALLPEKERTALLSKAPDASIASWALRFAASLENVMLVLSGMSDLCQMQDNLLTFSSFNPLTDADNKLLLDTAASMRAIPTIPCTRCGYCKDDCPMQINIPGVLDALNALKRFGNKDKADASYQRAVSEGGKASDCVGCGACAERCPQGIAIPDCMAEAAETFE